MLNSFRVCALATVLLAGAAAAQDNSPADAGQSWLESTIASCVQQYGKERCQDQQFLDEHFYVTSLQVAHNAAIQRNAQEQRALRELTLQRVCGISASDNCASDADPERCMVQMAQSCAILQAEANNCAQSAQLVCAGDADPSTCEERNVAFCPSFKKQPIEQLLARYPQLSAAQKSRLTAAAAEIDTQTGGWWSNAVAWLKTPFR